MRIALRRKQGGCKMVNAGWIHIFFMALAIVFEVSANCFIKVSHGFSRRLYGFASIVCILAAFTALAQAVKGIDLSVAYAAWGGIGMVLTMLIGQLYFRQKVRYFGWFGVLLIISGVVLLKTA